MNETQVIEHLARYSTIGADEARVMMREADITGESFQVGAWKITKDRYGYSVHQVREDGRWPDWMGDPQRG